MPFDRSSRVVHFMKLPQNRILRVSLLLNVTHCDTICTIRYIVSMIENMYYLSYGDL